LYVVSLYLHSFPTRRSSDLDIATQPDGKILFAGDFNYYNTNGTKKLFYRLTGGTPGSTLATAQPTKVRTELYPNPSNGNINIRRSEEHTSELQSRENLVCRL